jgi:EmrB/QacA subfamily drug resistance transporter
MLLAALGASSINVALPTLARGFDASFQAVQWVALAYSMALTTLAVNAGRLGDALGRRRVLLAGIIVFTSASLAAALAPGLPWLIAARALQGLGAALIMALSLALAGEAVPPGRTGSAMGLLGTMSAVGTALGPSLGGLLVDASGWRAIFLLNVPLGLAALALGDCYLPAASGPRTADKLQTDLGGTLLLSIALGAFTLGLTLGRGHFGPFNLALLLGAGFSAMLFVTVQRQSEAPLLDMSIFADGVLTRGLAANTLVMTVLMATLIIGPFYLSAALGLQPAELGLVMALGPAVVALAGLPAGRLADRLGAPIVAKLGLTGLGAGSLLLALLPAAAGLTGYVGPLAILTAGYALFQTANNTSVMTRASAERRGLVASMLNLSRSLGLIAGTALMGTLFVMAAGVSEPARLDPQTASLGLHATFLAAAGLCAAALAVVSRNQVPDVKIPA